METCDYRRVPCPNDGCGRIAFVELLAHMPECLHRIVQCPHEVMTIIITTTTTTTITNATIITTTATTITTTTTFLSRGLRPGDEGAGAGAPRRRGARARRDVVMVSLWL